MKTTAISLPLFVVLSIASFAGCETPDAEELAAPPAPIVGGTETNYESWQSVVALVTLMNGKPVGICSGSLIHPEVVLTAGHCVRLAGGLLSPSYDHTKNPQNLLVKFGAFVGPAGGKGELLSETAEAVHHPTWNGDINTVVQKGGFDIALVHLATPATGMGTYCVREGEQPVVDEKGIIVGYGLTGTGLTATAGTHRWGDTSVRQVKNATIEIGNPTATCQGDSGGPLFTLVEDKWEITGVTSYGGQSCLANRGAFSANVVSEFAWINEQVEKWTGDSLNDCTLCGPTEPCAEPVPTDEPDTQDSATGEGEGEGEGGEGDDEEDGGAGAEAEGCGCSAVGGARPTPFLSVLWSLLFA